MVPERRATICSYPSRCATPTPSPRLPSSQRKKWRLTLFAEGINLTDRRNLHVDSYNGYGPRTAAARLSFIRMFPILPSAGLEAKF